jgi:hypothetical protein
MHNEDPNNLTKIALDNDPSLRGKYLKRIMDRFAKELSSTYYDIFDLCKYPETENLAKEYLKTLGKVESSIARLRIKEKRIK